jgi:hypothetical protein
MIDEYAIIAIRMLTYIGIEITDNGQDFGVKYDRYRYAGLSDVLKGKNDFPFHSFGDIFLTLEDTIREAWFSMLEKDLDGMSASEILWPSKWTEVNIITASLLGYKSDIAFNNLDFVQKLHALTFTSVQNVRVSDGDKVVGNYKTYSAAIGNPQDIINAAQTVFKDSEPSVRNAFNQTIRDVAEGAIADEVTEFNKRIETLNARLEEFAPVSNELGL